MLPDLARVAGFPGFDAQRQTTMSVLNQFKRFGLEARLIERYRVLMVLLSRTQPKIRNLQTVLSFCGRTKLIVETKGSHEKYAYGIVNLVYALEK